MLSLTTFADELEREKARQRTRDAMMQKAQSGHVTGGWCYGYRNVEVTADGRRSHVTREIEPAEAAIVRRTIQLCTEGHGVKAIAKQLVDDPMNSRPIVSSLLKGRVAFTPTSEAGWWEARGQGSFQELFTRVSPRGVASPTGAALLGLAVKSPRIRWMLPLAA